MDLKWIEGFINSVKNDKNVTISANKEGLLTLADQLISLAKEESGTHIHYDEYNSLEDGSSEMIIEKI